MILLISLSLDIRVCELLRRLAGSDEGLVFGLTSSALSMRVIRLCKRAGLKGEKLGPHTLRHSSASLVASETKNAIAVKALLQHDNIQTSMIYVHDVEEELRLKYSEYDRHMIVGDPRRREPKHFGGPGARAKYTKSYR